MTKICRKCNCSKEVSEFGKLSKSKDGFAGACKECENARLRKLWRDRPDLAKARMDRSKARICAENSVETDFNRTCNVCNIEKHCSDFHRTKHLTGGRSYTCKQCAIIRARKDYADNKYRHHENVKKWIARNPEKEKEHRRRYKTKNRESIRAKGREYSAKNRARFQALHKYRMETDPSYAEKSRFRSAVGAHKRREKMRSNDRGLPVMSIDQWKAILYKCDSKCLKCGSTEKMTMDHVIPVDLGGTSIASNMEPLCLTCNDSKGNKMIDYRPWIMDYDDIGLDVVVYS